MYYKNINNKNYSELIEHKVLFFSPSEIIGGIGSYLGSNAYYSFREFRGYLRELLCITVREGQNN